MTYEIVPATEALLVEVEGWLDAEEAAHQTGEAAYVANGYEGDVPPRGFRVNWDTTNTRALARGGWHRHSFGRRGCGGVPRSWDIRDQTGPPAQGLWPNSRRIYDRAGL